MLRKLTLGKQEMMWNHMGKLQYIPDGHQPHGILHQVEYEREMPTFLTEEQRY
jgi:hypothetical protein